MDQTQRLTAVLHIDRTIRRFNDIAARMRKSGDIAAADRLRALIKEMQATSKELWNSVDTIK